MKHALRMMKKQLRLDMEHTRSKQDVHSRPGMHGNVAIHLHSPRSYSCNQEAFMVKFVALLYRI